MIVDSSAVVAVIVGEAEADVFADVLASASKAQMSAVNWLEAAIVVDGRRNPVASRRFDDLVAAVPIEIVPVTSEQVVQARAAYRDFGRGSGHPARLNVGDCFAYALARVSGAPLLYRGADFAATGIPSAVVTDP